MLGCSGGFHVISRTSCQYSIMCFFHRMLRYAESTTVIPVVSSGMLRPGSPDFSRIHRGLAGPTAPAAPPGLRPAGASLVRFDVVDCHRNGVHSLFMFPPTNHSHRHHSIFIMLPPRNHSHTNRWFLRDSRCFAKIEMVCITHSGGHGEESVYNQTCQVEPGLVFKTVACTCNVGHYNISDSSCIC